jgi:multicomponent Na+:H+ antiporter subunit D
VGAGLLTLMYILRTWQLVFQQAPAEGAKIKPASAGDSLFAPALLIGLCVLLGMYAAPLVEVATRAAEQLGDPQNYIHAVLGG